MTASNAKLEQCLTLYVARGSGLQESHVMPGNDDGWRYLKNDPFASLLLVSDRRDGYPIFTDSSETQTTDLVYRTAHYSLQFHRAGAMQRAAQFEMWNMSQVGLFHASSAFTTGQIKYVKVLDGGSGYRMDDLPAVSITDPVGGSGAAAAVESVSGGRLSLIRVGNRGSGYVCPEVSISGGAGRGATAEAHGYGFASRFPLQITRQDDMTGDRHDEAAVIDWHVTYPAIAVSNVGRVDRVEGSITMPAGRDPDGNPLTLTESVEPEPLE